MLIANATDADPGFVGERLRRHGFAFTECHRERPGEWPDLDGHDLVLSLGSDWSVYWPHVAASVEAEAALLRRASATGVPVLGICFGNQMLAHALGGSVAKGRRPEIGWYDVETDQPEHVAAGPWLQWHGDVVTVPAGAIEFARSAVGPQAWTLGRNLAVQFHPEATETMLSRWSSGGGAAELAAVDMTPDDLMDATRRHVGTSRRHSDVLVDWFLDHIATVPVVAGPSATL